MKKLTIVMIVIFLTIFYILPAHSAVKKLAQTGLQFLKVDVGTRAAAMGGSYVMIGDDATAMFYNPAGIAKMNYSADFFVTQTQWIADISYNAAGIVKNLGTWGHVGVSFITCDYGEVIGTQVASNEKGFIETGNLDVSAYAVGLSYAKELTEKFTVGGQVKYAREQLGHNVLVEDGPTVENKVSGLAYDFGTMFYPGFKSFRMGMSIRNFSPQFKYQQEAFQLPLTFIIGFAMDVLDFMGEHENSFLISVDAMHPRDYTERIHIGGEYVLLNMLALRGGYKFNYDEEGLTAGVGFNSKLGNVNIRVGYSYSEMGLFDPINRLSVGISF